MNTLPQQQYTLGTIILQTPKLQTLNQQFNNVVTKIL